MLFAQVSDLHICSQEPIRLQRLTQLVGQLNQWQPKVDALLLSGDLTDKGDSPSYRQLFDVLARLNMPYFWVLGNHDLRTNAIHSATVSPSLNGNYYNWLVDTYALNLIGLDSLQEGQASGFLSEETLDFLQQKLQQYPDKPTLVMLHHPPINSGVDFMDKIKLENHHALADIILNNPQVIRLCCGHLHRSLHTSFADSILSVCPALSAPIALNLSLSQNDFGMQEGAQFLLHHYQNGQLNTHNLSL